MQHLAWLSKLCTLVAVAVSGKCLCHCLTSHLQRNQYEKTDIELDDVLLLVHGVTPAAIQQTTIDKVALSIINKLCKLGIW